MSDRPARVILEPRASSHVHRIVRTCPVPRRFHTIHLSPWRAESETVLDLSWVPVAGIYAVYGMTVDTFGGL